MSVIRIFLSFPFFFWDLSLSGINFVWLILSGGITETFEVIPSHIHILALGANIVRLRALHCTVM